jgi:glutathione S-transferase
LKAKGGDPEFVKTQLASARTRLQVVEDLLKYNKSSGKGGYLAGDEAGHADACLFGWYAFCRTNEVVVKGVWEDESLPEVKAWVARVTKEFVKEGELP